MKIKYTISLLAGLAIAATAFGKTIPNYAAADLVLGQTNFTSNLRPSPPNAASLKGPTSVIVDPVTRKVFVADQLNHRVLRYSNVAALTNGAAAEVVLGQVDFTTSANPSPPNERSMNSPASLFLDRLGRLWVSDLSNNRVLMFSSAAVIGSNSAANRVFGQLGFTTNTQTVSAEGMYGPTGVWVDANDRLWVADSENSRVLRFDNISNKASGAVADGVLGQSDFTTRRGGSGASKFRNPVSITVSPTGVLFVADGGNNRVLRFNNGATLGNGASADAVFGQPDFTSTADGISAVQMSSPFGLTVTPDDSLWVSDFSNSRVIRFDEASSKPSGSAATGVIGQPDYNSNTASTSTQGLSSPAYNPFVDTTGSLWVPDYGNNRVLRYPAVATLPTVAVAGKFKKPTSKKKITLKGTANDPNGISLVQYKIGKGPLKPAVGTTAWQITTPLKKGKNTITIIATDPWGDVSVNKVIKIKRK
jgi:sugar lactone lactonase YvrE